MFKEENRIYWYLIGTVIMMFLFLYAAKEIFIPFILGQPTALDPGEFQYFEPPDRVIAVDKNYFAEIDTNYGKITVDLLERNAPNNVNNFVFLSNEGYYAGTKFHRLIPGLLVQGGDRNTLNDNPGDDGYGNPGYFIADEVNWDSINLSESQRQSLRSQGYSSTAGIKSVRLRKFYLAMANAGPDSNSNHFFIVLADSKDPRLNELQGKYTVFGRVVAGGSVLQKVNNIEVDSPDALVPRPTKDIILKSIKVYTK